MKRLKKATFYCCMFEEALHDSDRALVIVGDDLLSLVNIVDHLTFSFRNFSQENCPFIFCTQ